MRLEEEKQLTLCVDEGSENFKENADKNTARLYNDKGEPSEVTNSALEFAKHYHQHEAITTEFVKAMQESDLFKANSSNITLSNGRKISLNGFMILDEEAFLKLPDEKIIEFRQKGWLGFIYFALLSATNWRRIGDFASINESGGKKKA